MKKVLEICSLMSVIFVFLLLLLDISIQSIDKVFMLKFIFNILKTYFSIVGFILIFKNFEIKTNNRANMMGVCFLLSSIILIINLLLCIIYRQCSYMYLEYILSGLAGEFIEIIFLYFCINYVDEYSHLGKWVLIASIIFSVMIGSIFLNWPWQRDIRKYIYLHQLETLSAFEILVIMAGILSSKKLKKMTLAERRIFILLYADKYIINMLTIIMRDNLSASSSVSLNLIINILQLLFYILVFTYIDERSLSITWRKINLNVIDKMEQANQGEIANSILTASAKEIKRSIETIDVESRQIEERMAGKDTKEIVTYINKIEKNCNRLLKLSGNILALDNVEEGDTVPHFQEVNLSMLIENIVESVEPYLEEKKIRLQYIHFDKIIRCEVDPEIIERILLNLISNSIKYNKKEGSITIFLSDRRGEVYLSVQDTGVGISEEQQMLIFKRYERVNSQLCRQQEGSGLGLAIVKKLVDCHHGKIELRSKENKGTIFSILLPKKQKRSAEQTEREEKEKSDLSKKIQVEFSDLGV